MLLLVVITIAVTTVLYYFIVKPYNYWKERGVQQGNPKWILGDNWRVLLRQQSMAEMVEQVYNQCSGVRYFGIYQFLLPTLVVRDPDLIKQVAIKDFDHFTDHRGLIPDTEPLWGKNLFALKGKQWHDMRTILSPCFTSAKIKTMYFLISECAENFVQHFLVNNVNKDVITLEFKDAFTCFANDVIATIAFGIKVDSLTHPNNIFLKMGKEVMDFGGLWKNLKLFGFLIFPRIFELLKIRIFSSEASNFFKDIVDETIRTREAKNIIRTDMLHLLLEARKGILTREQKDIIDTGFATAQESNIGKSKVSSYITDRDIAAQAMIFFMAGFDSVAGLMSFLAYELVANPAVQDRLRNEIRSTLKDSGDKLSYEILLKMKYLDMVISEILRKWPLAIAADRVCTKPYIIKPVQSDEKPIYLEKGSVLWLPIFGIHRDPKYFPDPERFDPERFNVENIGNIKPYTYFPFGLGPRNCIGSRFALLEIKLLAFHVLYHFEIVSVEKTRIPLRLSKKNINVVSEDGFWFGLKHIEN